MSALSLLDQPVAAEVKYCRDCQEQSGIRVPAERILPGGTRLCDFHWRKRAGMRPLSQGPPRSDGSPDKGASPALSLGSKLSRPKVPAAANHPEEEKMPARKVIDWDAVQRDRDLGMSVTEICEKYRVSNPTVYKHTHGAPGTSGHKSVGRAEKKLSPKASAKTGAIASALEHLRAQRDELNELIASLEKFAEK